MKYALIGCGRISPNHLEAAINNNLEIVGICDIVPENMDKLLDKLSSNNHTKYAFLSLGYSREEKEIVRKDYLDKFDALYNLALRDSFNMINDIRNSLQNKKVRIIAFDKSAI